MTNQRFFVPTHPKKAIYQYGLAGGPAFGCNTLTVQEAPEMNAPNNGRCHTEGVNEYYGIPNDEYGNSFLTGEGKGQWDGNKRYTIEEIEVYSILI